MTTPDATLYEEWPATVTDFNPHDPNHLPVIERHLVACCLWEGGYDDAAEVVTAADFALPEHALAFAACGELKAAGSEPVPANVFQHLKRAHAQAPGALRPFGDDLYAWLRDTVLMEPTGYYARYYAKCVREASLLRQLRGAASEIMGMAENPPGPAREVLGRAERLLFELTDVTGARADVLYDAPTVFRETLQAIDDAVASGGRLGGLPTGYADLDHLLGGLRPGQVVVVGGRPGDGKTALSLNVLANNALAGVPTLFFSLEMPRGDLGRRMVATESGVELHKLNRGHRLSDAEAAAIVRAGSADRLAGCGIYVDDTTDQPAARMLSVARRAVRRYGIQLVVVDYLQLMRAENPRENRTQQVGLCARRVKQLARECNVPVILPCQLNRQPDARGDGRPRLSDLRESGEIEAHADAVLLLHVPGGQEEDAAVWDVDVIVAKNRNGPRGTAGLCYRRPVLRFENRAVGVPA